MVTRGWHRTTAVLRVSGALLFVLAIVVPARSQTISGHVYDHHGDPLAGIVVAYSLAGNVQDDTTAADGAYLLSFDTSGVPSEEIPQTRITTWGKLKAGFRDAVGAHSKIVAEPMAVIFPDTLYFLGGANYWSNTHPLPAPSEPVTLNMALPPTVYIDIPTEGAIPIYPLDFKDFHDLIGAPVPPNEPPAAQDNCRLWHPDRIQARIAVDIRPEWSQEEYQYIREFLQWNEDNVDIKAVYGMDSLFNVVPRGSLTAYTPGAWRIREGTIFVATATYELINGEYFCKHVEITLQYGDPNHMLQCLHEFMHGYDAMLAHVDWDSYNWDGQSLMNGSPPGIVPPDKAYPKLAYQLQKLRLVDGKHDGFECFYCIMP